MYHVFDLTFLYSLAVWISAEGNVLFVLLVLLNPDF